MTPSKTVRPPHLPRKADQESKKLKQAVKNLYFLVFKQKKDANAAADRVNETVVDALLEAEEDQDNI